jgi:hypothetical protein
VALRRLPDLPDPIVDHILSPAGLSTDGCKTEQTAECHKNFHYCFDFKIEKSFLNFLSCKTVSRENSARHHVSSAGCVPMSLRLITIGVKSKTEN